MTFNQVVPRSNRGWLTSGKTLEFFASGGFVFLSHISKHVCEEMSYKLASTRDYLDFVLEQLSLLDDITYRAMMGEYVIYYRGKVVGGVYDNRFLVKPVKAAAELLPDTSLKFPYESSKGMFSADDVIDDREFLKNLFEAMYG